MEALLVVHVLDELADARLRFGKGGVLLEVDLLLLERFEEALSFGVVYGLPLADMLACAPTLSNRSTYAQLAYRTPLSEW
jgi:hypothetical protein